MIVDNLYYALCGNSELCRLFGHVNDRLGIDAADLAGAGVNIELLPEHERTHYHAVIAAFKADIFTAVIPVADTDGGECVVKSGLGIYIFHGISPY